MLELLTLRRSSTRVRIESLLADPSTADSYSTGGAAMRGRLEAMRLVELRSTDPNHVEAEFAFHYGR